MVQKYQERLYSVEEYLTLENESLEKHEYYRGHIYQMSGGSPETALITGNTIGALTVALRDKGAGFTVAMCLSRCVPGVTILRPMLP